jgi:DNA-binding winged helix-turn-helix (wHTH) protein
MDLASKKPTCIRCCSIAVEKMVNEVRKASRQSGGSSEQPLSIVEITWKLDPSARSSVEPRVTVLRVGSLELDLIDRTAKRGTRPIDLLPREFQLLKYMMQRSDQLLTRANIIKDVWHYNFVPETNVMNVHMGRLRRKVDGSNDAPMIRNVRGKGLVLSANPLLAKNLPGPRRFDQNAGSNKFVLQQILTTSNVPRSGFDATSPHKVDTMKDAGVARRGFQVRSNG